MPKLYVISDVHGYYNEMKEALDKVGFDPENENHWLICCGDCFDRGPDPIKVMRYLMNLPRKFLIKGNHEELFTDLCTRGYPMSHDIHNGTARTVWHLGYENGFNECCKNALKFTRTFFNQMVDYMETERYIFVHSWVPLMCKDNLPMHYTKNRKFEYNLDWRDATQKEWSAARWGNPFELAEQGFNQTGKIIVCGHWHASAGWAKAEGRSEFGEDAKFDPYFGDGFIAIDACTAHTNRVNVLVLEDEFLK